MKRYVIAVDGCANRTIDADGDDEAQQAAMDHLLLSLDAALSRTQFVRLLRDDGSDVWVPNTVANVVS